MSALMSELSGALSLGLPPQSSERSTQRLLPFPGNMAVGPIPNALIAQAEGSESTWHQDYLWAAQTFRKPPQREGVVTEFLASNRVLWGASNRQLEADIAALKTEYIFRNGSAITHFILGHRTVPAILSNALPELKKSFGEDVVFNLEAVIDDDESTSLYGIVVWRGPADGAESALEDFDERWWLNQPAQPGLTFTYELA